MILPNNTFEIVLYFVTLALGTFFVYFFVIKSKWVEYRILKKIVRRDDFNKLGLMLKCPYDKKIYIRLSIIAFLISLLVAVIVNAVFFYQLTIDPQVPLLYQMTKFLELFIIYYILKEVPIESDEEMLRVVMKPLKTFIESILDVLIVRENKHIRRELNKDIYQISSDKKKNAGRVCNLILRLKNKSFSDRYNLTTDVYNKLMYFLFNIAGNYSEEYEYTQDDLAYLILSFLPKNGMVLYDLAVIMNETKDKVYNDPMNFLSEFSTEKSREMETISLSTLESDLDVFLER